MSSRREFLEMMIPGGWAAEAVKNKSLALSPAGQISLVKDGIILSGLITGHFALPNPDSLPEIDSFSAPELMRLAKEVRDWKIGNQKVLDLFPENQKTVSIMAGEINPQEFIPYAKPRVYFSNNEDDASLYTQLKSVPEDELSKGILIQFPSGSAKKYRWLDQTQSTLTIKISSDIQRSTLRLPIAVKEVSQITDYPEYAKAYLEHVRDQGVAVTLINNKNELLSEAEALANAAEDIAANEVGINNKDYSQAFFHTIVDMGSHIRVGGIMFANWYQDQIHQGKAPADNLQIRNGKGYASFLAAKDIIKIENGLWVWSNGSPPEINSSSFIDLVKDLSHSPGAKF
jgi:hypothetical protein